MNKRIASVALAVVAALAALVLLNWAVATACSVLCRHEHPAPHLANVPWHGWR